MIVSEFYIIVAPCLPIYPLSLHLHIGCEVESLAVAKNDVMDIQERTQRVKETGTTYCSPGFVIHFQCLDAGEL